MILEQIARDTKIRVTNQKKKVPLGTLKKPHTAWRQRQDFLLKKHW